MSVMCWRKWPCLCLTYPGLWLTYPDGCALLRIYGFVPVFYVAYVILLSVNALFVLFYFLIFMPFLASSSLARSNSVLEDVVCFVRILCVLFCLLVYMVIFVCVCPIMGSIYGYCILGFLLSQEVHYIWRYILTFFKRSGFFSSIKCLTY